MPGKKLWGLGVLVLFGGIVGCKKPMYTPMAEYSGYTQGGTYHIVCDSAGPSLDAEIEALLKNLDHSVSLWDSTSLISRFNRSQAGVAVDEHFAAILTLSKRIHAETEGAFNPAVYPLMVVWGLDKNATRADSLFRTHPPVDSMLRYTRLEDITLGGVSTDSTGKKGRFVSKKYPQNGLDFNGIAPGYAVDLLCGFLDGKGITNYKVEVSEEVRSKGKDSHGNPWVVAIDHPTGEGEPRQVGNILPLGDKALSVSGSYRRYYEKEGKRLSYRIDPATGKPAEHTLLSATVWAGTAAEADAYATAFMAMGAGKTTRFLVLNRQVWAYLVSSGFDNDFQTWLSPELEKRIEEGK